MGNALRTTSADELRVSLLERMKRIHSKTDLKEWIAYEKVKYGIKNEMISRILGGVFF